MQDMNELSVDCAKTCNPNSTSGIICTFSANVSAQVNEISDLFQDVTFEAKILSVGLRSLKIKPQHFREAAAQLL